jgi:hypothetical protein
MFISVPGRIGFRLKVSLSDPDPFRIRTYATRGYHRKAVIISVALGGRQGVFRFGTVQDP